MSRTTTDALSLTLPVASRSKARRRKIKPPNRQTLWYLAWTIWCIAFGIRAFLRDEWGFVVCQAIAAGWYWRAALRAREGRQPPSLLWWSPWVLIVSVLLITGGS